MCAAVAEHPPDDLAVTVITVEEQLSGWYSLPRQSRKPQELAGVYRRLAENVAFLARVEILSFTEEAIARLENLRAQKLGISHEHLGYYLDEFTFRFNRRTSASRGKLFFRLIQQAMLTDPAPCSELNKGIRPGPERPVRRRR